MEFAGKVGQDDEDRAAPMMVDDAGHRASPSRSGSRSPSYSPELPDRSPLSRRSISRSVSPMSHDGGRRRRFSLSPSRSPGQARRYDSRLPRNTPTGRHAVRRTSDRTSHRDIQSVEILGLTKLVYESHLDQIFGMYGAIREILLPRFRRSGESRGKAYVIYESASGAVKAEENMDGGQIDGGIVSVRQEEVPAREYENLDHPARRHPPPTRHGYGPHLHRAPPSRQLPYGSHPRSRDASRHLRSDDRREDERYYRAREQGYSRRSSPPPLREEYGRIYDRQRIDQESFASPPRTGGKDKRYRHNRGPSRSRSPDLDVRDSPDR